MTDLTHCWCIRYKQTNWFSSIGSSMSWLFLDWFVPLYLLVSVLVLAGFGACLYFLEPGLQDAHKWSNKTVRHHPLVASVNCRDDDRNALIWSRVVERAAGHLDRGAARTWEWWEPTPSWWRKTMDESGGRNVFWWCKPCPIIPTFLWSLTNCRFSAVEIREK